MAFVVQQRKVEPLQQGDILVVVHDFDARSADELTLRKTDRVELVELDDGFGDGWYLGRHLGRGTTGLFPGVYTAKLPAHIAATLPSSPPKSYSVPAQVHPTPPVSPTGISTGDSERSEPKLGGYQHRASEPIISDTRNAPGSPLAYGQVAALGAQRNTLPTGQGSSNYIQGVQRSIGQALGSTHAGEDSPVMNETLSVIDEHITDLSTPRQSLRQNESRQDDSESDYSSHVDHNSFVAGIDSDVGGLTQDEVSRWDAKQTAIHLRTIGVDPKHCDIFEEQEITGDVLLEMDQSFIYMKEYDFGVMGKRLKTWHKIRDFQEEVRGLKPSRQGSAIQGGSTDDVSRAQPRALSGGTILPRIPSLMEKPGLSIRQSQQSQPAANDIGMPPPLQMQQSGNTGSRSSTNAMTPPSAWRASMGLDSPSRPSAALVREMSKSRRHSSIDFGKQPGIEQSAGSPTPHKKQTSLDRSWSVANTTSSRTDATSTGSHMHSIKKQGSLDMSADSPLLTDVPNLALDKGYFSGNEVDKRKSRNLLRKRDSLGSPADSPQDSLVNLSEPKKTSSIVKRHSRLSSVDSIRDQALPLISPASKAYHSKYYKGKFRSTSARHPTPILATGGTSPTVTNLENEGILPLTSLPSPTSAGGYANAMVNVQSKARKLMGLRAASEAVTETEKETLTGPTLVGSQLEESLIASPDGSHTPSARSPSLDNTDTSSRGTDQHGSALGASTSMRSRPKTKQQTSAYTQGLLKTTPLEARKHCDHHGWMKKKSSSLMTTWKPRLFILRGRRLSYYYSENDTEERGIIDISGHKVLVANSDPIITLHATITGATASASPTSGTGTTDTSPVASKSAIAALGGPFYFKLVPPKAGFPRAVQFTKPTVHYFQVDTIAEGRKWMGEIMKATIEHDFTSFATTNKQKTISLAKAKARKERPPALMETKAEPTEAAVEEKESPESGLNIQGLGFDEKRATAGAASGEKQGSDLTKEMEKIQTATT